MVWSTGCCPPWASPQWIGSRTHGRHAGSSSLRVWRWTGYNMVFYLAGLQNIDYSIYEAARIDGASPLQQFVHLTIPLLKPTILLTAIMSTSGTLQLFDESVNLTAGGPGKATMTLTHYIYNISFVETPKFNYAAALSVFILVVVAVLSAIQMKVGDKRD